MNTTSNVLVIHSRPRVEPASQGGWEFVLWLGDAFDYSIPFREALSSIASVVGDPTEVRLNLPPYDEGEDFVEGTLDVGEHVLDIYYEYSLGYLSLMSNDRSVLEFAAAKILPLVRVR